MKAENAGKSGGEHARTPNASRILQTPGSREAFGLRVTLAPLSEVTRHLSRRWWCSAKLSARAAVGGLRPVKPQINFSCFSGLTSRCALAKGIHGRRRSSGTAGNQPACPRLSPVFRAVSARQNALGLPIPGGRKRKKNLSPAHEDIKWPRMKLAQKQFSLNRTASRTQVPISKQQT
jgi:hypothetical protein